MTEESSGAAMAQEAKAAAKTEATAEEVKTDVGAESTVSTKEGTSGKDEQPEAQPPAVKPNGEAVPTLRQIFSLPEKDTDPADDQWKTFQETLSKEVKGIKWTAAMPDLAPKICELLDIKIDKVLLTAWKKVHDLRKVLEESKKTPEKLVYLELAEHSIEYQTKPFIDVKLKNTSVKKLTLNVQLDFKLRGFVLKVQNGAINEMETGDCEVKGTVKYGSLPIATKSLASLKLPFSIPISILENLIQSSTVTQNEDETKPETPKSEDVPQVAPADEPAIEPAVAPAVEPAVEPAAEPAVERIEL